MNKVVIDMSMSLDGFVAGPDDGKAHPLGLHGGEHVFDWYTSGNEPYESELFRPEAGPNRQEVERMFAESGAFIFGRRTYEITNGWGGRHPVRGAWRRFPWQAGARFRALRRDFDPPGSLLARRRRQAVRCPARRHQARETIRHRRPLRHAPPIPRELTFRLRRPSSWVDRTAPKSTLQQYTCLGASASSLHGRISAGSRRKSGARELR